MQTSHRFSNSEREVEFLEVATQMSKEKLLLFN